MGGLHCLPLHLFAAFAGILTVLYGVQAFPSTVRPASSQIVSVPPMSNFVLNGLKRQPPQTRYYEFTVSEMIGAPDGVEKPMLVVNGMSDYYNPGA